MNYAEKYLPKKIQLFLLTPPKYNKYKLKRTEIIEVAGNKINFILKLRKFCKENNIDLLVNLGTVNETFGMVFATSGLKTEYIINFMGNIWDAPQKKLSEKIFLFIKKTFLTIPFIFAKRIIQPSSDICNKTKKHFFFIKNKIKQSPLIIDEKLFFPKNEIKVRKKLKLPIKKDIVLSIGRIFYLKGSDILLELIKKNPEKLFVLIGEVMDSNYERQKLANLLIVSPVKVEKLVDYYNSADLFIFPSRVEAYGLVHREAMLCETPALVSDIPALRLTKYAFKAKLTMGDMQKKINKFFLMSKEERKKLGEVSRKYIIETNSYDILKNDHKNLLLN